MAAEIVMDWPGQSGKNYRYYGYLRGTDMKEVPANYIYAKRNVQGHWVPVYIGECGNLKERCLNHHKLECMDRNGATHIFVHLSSEDRQLRLNEETDLRARFNTTCNDQ